MSRPKGSKNKSKEDVIETPSEDITKISDADPKDDTKPIAKPAHVQRLAMLNEISAMNQERQAEEDAEDVPVESETVVETKEENNEETDESEDELHEATAPKEPEIPVIGKHKFTVNGKEIELTDDEVRARIQKSEAADQRLAEATRLLEDARRATSIKESPQPSAKPSADVGDDQIIKEATQAFVYGNSEEIAKAIAAILGKGRPVSIPEGMTPQQVQGYVVETMAYKDGLRLLETSPEQGGYADVYSDPVLKARFHQREAELRDVQGDKRPYAELYRSIGDELRQWRDSLIKQHVQPTGLEDRDAKKAATGVIRGAGGRQVQTPSPQVRKSAREAHEDTVSQMRQSRGLNH